jgi:menaquinol-cytochrome c reductase iron-sulfur subunit
MEQEKDESRRGFLTATIYSLMGAIGAALGIPAFGYLLLPPRGRRKDSWIEAADVSKLVVNQPEQVIFQRVRKDGWKTVTEKAAAWVVKTGEEKVVAYSPVCTHLGCAVNWDTGKKNFVCPCHASSFDANGRVLAGPAPRPLDRYDVKLVSGKVMLGDVKPVVES